MNRTEINKHPSIVPFLEAWRKARAERDRITTDDRYGVESCHTACDKADAAEREYDAAVAALTGTREYEVRLKRREAEQRAALRNNPELAAGVLEEMRSVAKRAAKPWPHGCDEKLAWFSTSYLVSWLSQSGLAGRAYRDLTYSDRTNIAKSILEGLLKAGKVERAWGPGTRKAEILTYKAIL